jgi:D-arabinose 1-dehydrogenase-like Zn-dependent alcohol dehydrogenase
LAVKLGVDWIGGTGEIPIIPEVREFGLHQANEALILLKQGKIQGAGVLGIPE